MKANNKKNLSPCPHDFKTITSKFGSDQTNQSNLGQELQDKHSAGPARPRTAALATAGMWAPTEVSLSRSSGDIHRGMGGWHNPYPWLFF